MKNKSIYVEVGDLKAGDLFYPSRELGWCIFKHITGFSFFTGNQNMWVESLGDTKHDKEGSVSLPINKKVRIKKR